MAAHSFSFSSSASCASTRRSVVEGRDEVQRLAAAAPVMAAARRLAVERDELCSVGRSDSAESVKQAWKRPGSIRFITTRSQSAQGVPKWNSEKERRKGRCCSPYSAISS